MDKIKNILAKAKELSEELYSVTYEEYRESHAEELIFNKEVKGIRLEMLCVQDRIEALVHYIEGEYSCPGCGKWFTPLSDINFNVDCICPECEEKFRKKAEQERRIYDIENAHLRYCRLRQVQ